MREIEFDNIKYAAWEMQKGFWAAIKPMLESLSDDELEKIPDFSISEMGAIESAERYGICDIISKKGKWISVYCICGSIFRGKEQFHNPDEE